MPHNLDGRMPQSSWTELGLDPKAANRLALGVPNHRDTQSAVKALLDCPRIDSRLGWLALRSALPPLEKARIALHWARQARLRDDLKLAGSVLRRVAPLLRESPDPELAANAANLRGALQALAGQPQAAQKSYQQALSIASSAGFTHPLAAATFNLGLLRLQARDPASAFRLFSSAKTLFSTLKQDHSVAVCDLNLGNVHQDSGRPEDALARYRVAREALLQLGDASRAAVCQMNAANALCDLHRFNEAIRVYEVAEAEFQANENRRMAAASGLNRALAHLALGDCDAASQLALACKEVFTALDDMRGIAECCLCLARAAFGPHAEAWLSQAAACYEGIRDPAALCVAKALLALTSDNPSQLQAALKSAYACVMSAGTIAALDPVVLDEIACSAAWLLTKSGQPRQAADLLLEHHRFVAKWTYGRSPNAAPERRAILRRRFDSIQSDLASANTKAERVALERESGLLLARLAESGSVAQFGSEPELAGEPGPMPAGETVWFVCSCSLGVLTLVVSETHCRGVCQAIKPWKLRELAAAAQAELLDPKSNLTAIAGLSELVLGPVESELLSAKRIASLASGSLAHIPLGVLVTAQGQHLARGAEITDHWPMRMPTQPTGERFTLIAKSKFGKSSLPELPGVRAECRQIAAIVPSAKVVEEDRATLASFWRALASGGFVHLATHAVPAGSGMAGSALVLSGSAGNLAFVLGSDIRSRKNLNAPFVALSACSSVSGASSGAAVNLGKQLLASGVGCVLGSRWPVEDQASDFWMRKFYEALAGGTSVSAAQWFACQSMQGTRFSHPHFWAGWVVTGSCGE